MNDGIHHRGWNGPRAIVITLAFLALQRVKQALDAEALPPFQILRRRSAALVITMGAMSNSSRKREGDAARPCARILEEGGMAWRLWRRRGTGGFWTK